MIRYDSAHETLTLPDGSVWHAVSGGGRGRRTLIRDGKGRVRRRRVLADGGERDWTVKATDTLRGGPLPPGLYLVHPPALHPRLGPACLLEPYPGNAMRGRDDFWIHGPGRRGSDGCIVPLSAPGAGRGIHRLLRCLRRLAPTTLEVV
jgi:hypothetical protein